MKIKFTDLGPLKEGTFDLNKKLILLTGPNKSGKSWVAYSLYGVMRDSYRLEHDIRKEIINQIRDNKVINESIIQKDDDNISLDINKVSENLNTIFWGILQRTINSRIFSWYLANPKSQIIDASVAKIILKNGNFNHIEHLFKELIPDEVSTIMSMRGISYKCDLDLNANDIKVTVIDVSEKKLPQDHKDRYFSNNIEMQDELKQKDKDKFIFDIYFALYTFLDICINQIKKQVFFLPAERTFINQVAKDLNDYKAMLFDKGKYSDEGDINENADLTWAVREYLNFINRLRPTHQHGVSIPKYKSLAEGRLAKLIGGQLDVNDFGRIIYSEEEKPIPYHLTSSSIKMLSGLDFYLRFYMRMEVNHTIFIDEPELHLHADAQLEFAKLIGQMVNAGIQVVVSTHSELIIRQLNHLIYLNRPEAKDSPKWAEFCKEYDYQENDFLTPDDVAVYFFDGKGGCESLDIDETGFSVPTIETVLMQLNEEIYTFNDDILPSESE